MLTNISITKKKKIGKKEGKKEGGRKGGKILLISESKTLGTARLGKMSYMALLLRCFIFFGENKAKMVKNQRIIGQKSNKDSS